jgi:hypothetical protein
VAGRRYFALCSRRRPSQRAAGSPAADALNHAAELRDSGDFKGAAEVLTAGIARQLASPAERRNWNFSATLLKRIKHDYSLTKDELSRN